MDTRRLNLWVAVAIPKCTETNHVSQSSCQDFHDMSGSLSYVPQQVAGKFVQLNSHNWQISHNIDQKLSCRLTGSRSETFWVWQMTEIAPQRKRKANQTQFCQCTSANPLDIQTNFTNSYKSHWHVTILPRLHFLFRSVLVLHSETVHDLWGASFDVTMSTYLCWV